MNLYATAHEIKSELGQGEFDTADNELIKLKAIQASRLIDGYTRRKFYPRYAVKNYDHPCEPKNTLLLFDDLLSVSALTTDNGNTTITSANFFLMAGDQHQTPANHIALNTNANTWLYSTTPRAANAVTGIWGYHNDYDNAWQKIDDVQNNPLLVGDTSLTVASGEGEDERGLKPRFQDGQLIRFGSSVTAEYASVTKAIGNTLTIVRGVNGSTAAEQAQDVDVYVYRPQYDIQQAAVFLGIHLYRRKDGIGTLGDQPIASPSGVILAQKIPSEVKAVLDDYKVATF